MVITVEHLAKTYRTKEKLSLWKDLLWPKYRETKAVNDISFTIDRGEAVAFLGPNGAGKTTTMKMLAGLLFPTSGQVQVLGFTPFDRKPEFLRRIGLVMGNKASLEWDLTAQQSFSLFQKIYKISDLDFSHRVERYTTLLGTTKLLDRPIRKLSLGERLKMELIATLLYEPEILFLDEPTIGLDLTAKHSIRDFLRQLQAESGVTLLLTSHDMDDVEKVCDRVIVINEGQKVYDDSLVKLTSSYNEEKFVTLLFDILPRLEKVNPLAPVISYTDHSYTLKVPRTKLAKTLALVTRKLVPIDIEIGAVPLEEIISHLYQKPVYARINE